MLSAGLAVSGSRPAGSRNLSNHIRVSSANIFSLFELKIRGDMEDNLTKTYVVIPH